MPVPWKESLGAAISNWNATQLMVAVILLLAVFNTGLIAAAWSRFQRSNLMDV